MVVVPGDLLPVAAEFLGRVVESKPRGERRKSLGRFGQRFGVTVPTLHVRVRGVGAVKAFVLHGVGGRVHVPLVDRELGEVVLLERVEEFRGGGEFQLGKERHLRER